MGRASRAKKERKASSGSHSTLEQHQRTGKQLVPPLLNMPTLSLQSWSDDRLPEMLWAALLVSSVPRNLALGVFRAVTSIGHELEKAGIGGELTLSGMAALPQEWLNKIMEVFGRAQSVREALRPLLLFDDLPAKTGWENTIGMAPLPEEDWEHVANAVAKTFDHQSQEATDCRWARLMFVVLNGRLHLPREIAEELFGYPDKGDMRKVRPTIRSMEGSLSMMTQTAPSEWPERFWNQCLRDSNCFPVSLAAAPPVSVGTTTQRVSEVQRLLQEHALATRTTTAVDARHEGVFGLAAYGLTLLSELMRMSNGISVLGRLGLRSLLEVFVTCAYLVMKDNPDLWMEYRQYGSGQAKLAFLKIDRAGDTPESIDLELLQMLANEDRWLEFVSINLGNWGKTNLRQMSDDGGTKGQYDSFYDWTSAFVHGNWAAVRNTVYDVCANPLHRFHRFPRDHGRPHEDVVPMRSS